MKSEKLRRAEINPLYLGMTAYIKKMKGETTFKSNLNYVDLMVSAIGCLLAMSLISVIAVSLGYPMALGPIGASCLLIFGAHNGPFSQPRHIIGGHFIATFASLAIWDVFGKNFLTIGITLAVVIILMMVTGTIHPPAAASAIVAMNTGAGWGFILCMFICSLSLIVISLFYNNLFQSRQYPKFWL
ncbi:HPP family protein [Metabacillus sediminilitoris]|uniref:HPP family protein n=1 Tax=Metabacillus sediminilitoris TaxID=2567941 RepID=A0A4S4BN57_9BACI|nr:HPP family protein [Metabacillus sediminilitoris]QGQ48396.1 HPP family protein [Metabacillus sediminilitoris]THF76293.1 HPP family protein [Metabacillus sediminilitoris]